MNVRWSEIVEYAAHRTIFGLTGCSEMAVRNAFFDGTLASAVKEDGTVDHEEADRIWAENRQSPNPLGPHAASSTDDEDQPKRGPGRPTKQEIARVVAAAQEDKPPAAWESFQAARTRSQIADANKREFELQVMRGEFVDLATTRKIFASIGGMHRTVLSNLAASLASQLVNKTDMNEIQMIMEEEFTKAHIRMATEIRNRYQLEETEEIE